MDGVGKNFNGYKDIKTPFPNPFNKDEYSKIEIQNNQGAVIATYENKEGGSTTLLVGDGKDGFYFDPGTEDFNPTEYKVVLTKASDSTTTEIPLAGNTITKAERNIVLNTPTDAAATKTGENLVLSAKFPTGEANTFYNAEQLAGSGLSLNLAITVGGEVKTITVPLKGLTVAPEAEGSTKLNIPIPPDKLSNIKGQITKIDFSASTMEPSDTTKTATIDSLNIDFSGNTSIPTPTNNNQNQTSVVPNNTTTTNNTVQSSSTPSSSTASTMNPPPITVGNRTITGFESAVILQAALRNNKDSQGKPYYSGLITGNWDEPSANALKKYIADNTGKPIEKTLPKGTENVSGKLIGSWSSGDDVKTVQQTLNTKANDLKIAKLAEDGQFGPQTEAAIKAFQEYYNTKNTVKPIKIDGILGPETELAMNTQFNMTLFKTT
jgi:peptidoglycan hydrolase-like protein with peptidoglycan-binding domain